MNSWATPPAPPTPAECLERAVSAVDMYPMAALAHAAIGILRILLDEES